MKKLLPACLLICALSGGVSAGTVFDFRNDASLYGVLDDQAGPVSFTNSGIVATFTASDGVMNRTASGFGLNSTIVGDDTVGFDIGEWIDITFDISVTLTNVKVSSWSTVNGDQATIYIGGISNDVISSSGDHAFNIAVATGQVLRISSTDGIVGNGWSLDSIAVVDSSSIPSNLPPVLDPIGSKSVLELGTLSFVITADDPIDHDPITLSATNLPTGAFFSTNGVFTWSNAAPVGAYAVTFYATDKDGSDSETITITVSERPKLLISEIADPSGTGGDVYRFMELYNAGTNTIDLAADGWTLSKQVNGGTWYDIPLTGTVTSASAWVIAYSVTDFQDAYGLAPDQESSTVSGNGDDAYFLYYSGTHTNGVLIDIYGAFNTDGTDTAWDYEDSRAVRNNDILQPNTVWTASEWTITPNATTNDMTPGEHGPVPEFQGLENAFVFPGDSLSLIVTAVNTVLTNDVITLSATALPGDATFTTATGTGTVSGTLNWNSPTTGVYSATFAAAGAAGTNTASITVTVSSMSRIFGCFYGWSGDTIFKLDNGQFWQQSASGSKTVYPALYHPYISITNYLGYERRMYVTNVTGYVAVSPLNITESTVTNTFNGLQYQNIYQLADGTTWQQVSFDTASSNATSVTAWRWIENGQQKIRFLGRNNAVIGTCIVEASTPPGDTTIYSKIDGWFRGWQNKRVFFLKNGQFWQQTSLDSSTETLYSPDVTITNWLQTGNWRMVINGLSGYVSVQQLTNVTRTAVDRWFYGFSKDRIIHLQDGSWWKQTSSEISTSTRFGPEVLIWNENDIDYLEMPDEGRRIEAEPLTVAFESTVTNTFTGLHYGNLYRLDGAGDWLQFSFKTVSTNVSNPSVMLWTEGTQTNMIVRDSRDVTIGTCIIIDPVLDTDNDGSSNAAEMLAGSDPLDSQSAFTLHQTDRYVLRWETVEGRIYTIEWAPSLTESFQTLENNITWPQNCWTDTVHAVESAGFYRIRVQFDE
ncbi:MAG: hypothetical protein WC047_01305 [Kiritimatiellales bacterium]